MPATRLGELRLARELARRHASAPVVAVRIVRGDKHAIEPMLHAGTAGDDARLIVRVDRPQHIACRCDQVVDGARPMAGDGAVLRFAVVEQLVLHRTRPDRRRVDRAIEQPAVATGRQPPFQFQLEVAVRVDADDVAASGRGQREFAIADLPARVERGRADAAPPAGIDQRLPGRIRGRRTACQQCGEQDRGDPRAAHAQSTTRQNTAFR